MEEGREGQRPGGAERKGKAMASEASEAGMPREGGAVRGHGRVWVYMTSWRGGAARAAYSCGQLWADPCSTFSHSHTGQQGVGVC